MALTVGFVTARAREVLNDAANDRYTLPQLYSYVLEAYLIARRVRPDLFVYQLTTPIVAPVAEAEPLRLPDIYAEALANYVCGRAELRDDEFAVDGRAMTLMKSFESALISGA